MRLHQVIIVLCFMALLIIGSGWLRELIRVENLPNEYQIPAQTKSDPIENTTDPTTLSDYYWHIEYDSIHHSEYLQKGRLLDSLVHSPLKLIDILNKRDAKCRITLKEITKDTIIIEIQDAYYVTERMGSTGAFCYLGETVFTLTELEGIRFVRIEIDEGSHAGPGIYNRFDFNTLKQLE
jgi:hypothetical protein